MFSPDKPIHDPREDVLGRKRLSKKIAELIGKTGDGESIVLGIEGPWGSGKSSLINLIISELGD
ncbi:KAP family P-loop domain protein, partial [bacterium]|nr:KAP family P-loop domain protein [bacterium]